MQPPPCSQEGCSRVMAGGWWLRPGVPLSSAGRQTTHTQPRETHSFLSGLRGGWHRPVGCSQHGAGLTHYGAPRTANVPPEPREVWAGAAARDLGSLHRQQSGLLAGVHRLRGTLSCSCHFLGPNACPQQEVGTSDQREHKHEGELGRVTVLGGGQLEDGE